MGRRTRDAAGAGWCGTAFDRGLGTRDAFSDVRPLLSLLAVLKCVGTGALMAYEVLAAARGWPVRGVIEYDARASGRRLGVRAVRPTCACRRRTPVPA